MIVVLVKNKKEWKFINFQFLKITMWEVKGQANVLKNQDLQIRVE